MNSQFDKAPGLSLPQPQAETAPMATEQSMGRGEAAPQPTPGPLPLPSAGQGGPAAPTQGSPAAQSTPAATTQSHGDTGAPGIAEDSDLIEKEWVMKAKEIVARTRTDPHKQVQEMNRYKADYMHKRYNKEIQLTED